MLSSHIIKGDPSSAIYHKGTVYVDDKDLTYF